MDTVNTQLKKSGGALTARPRLLCLIFAILVFACSREDPQAIFDRAWNAFQHGDLAQAEQQANKGYDRFRGLGPDWAWKFAILRARVLYQRGMNEDVLKVLSSEKTSVPSGEMQVQKYRFEGLASVSLHRFAEAEQKLGQAEHVCSIHDYPPCADIVTARGLLEMARGNFARAQVYFGRVLILARESADQVWQAEALLNLSWSALEQTHFDEALDWAEAANAIATAQGVADIAQTAAGNIGWAYYRLGDHEKALQVFIEAARKSEKLGDFANEVKWLEDAGHVYMDDHNFIEAEASFRESLRLGRQIGARGDITSSLQALAFVSEKTNKLDEAQRYADEALSMARADGNKRDETYGQLALGLIAARQHRTATAEAAFREVAKSPDSPVFLKWQAEHSLARLYENENQPDAAERGYKTALSTFEQARSDIKKMDSHLPFLTNAKSIYDDYIHFLVAQGKTAQALQVAEFSRARTLAEGLNLLKKGTSFAPPPLNARQVAQRTGSTILFYSLGEKQSYLWAITRQKTNLFALPPESEIKAAVQRYGKALVGPQDVLDTANPDGLSLYRILVAPAKHLLGSSSPAKEAKVVIVPDGSLNGLNFETLLAPEPKLHYWIEDVTISNASSLRLLSATHTAGNKRASNVLILGDAVAASKDYPELPKAAVEMDRIAQHFTLQKQHVFKREQASPPAYLSSKPEQFSYIHFVAHGTASRLSPLDSAIVLSKATAADDSFKLYARDIIQHPLHAELVTISTCYGQGTRAYSGEGMVGLSWAFLRAGAHNVIGALWEVSDTSTPELMDRLYGELKKGEAPDAALRSAKLSLLRSGSAFRRPFYWAPFQLYAGS